MAELQEEYIWLSFRDADINKNLGCCVVKATNLIEAVAVAHRLKINPGGEVLSFPTTEQQLVAEGLEPDRLYSRQEMLDKKYKPIKIR